MKFSWPLWFPRHRVLKYLDILYSSFYVGEQHFKNQLTRQIFSISQYSKSETSTSEHRVENLKQKSLSWWKDFQKFIEYINKKCQWIITFLYSYARPSGYRFNAFLSTAFLFFNHWNNYGTKNNLLSTYWIDKWCKTKLSIQTYLQLNPDYTFHIPQCLQEAYYSSVAHNWDCASSWWIYIYNWPQSTFDFLSTPLFRIFFHFWDIDVLEGELSENVTLLQLQKVV